MPVVGIELSQSVFEGVDIIELELGSADHLDAFHDFDQPAARLESFIAQEKRPLPLCEYLFFRLRLPIPNNKYFSRCRNLVQDDHASDPAGAPCRGCERLPLLDDLAHKELFWNNEQVRDAPLFQIVFQKKEVGIVAGGQAVAHGAKGAVEHLGAERAL